ncbi:glutaminase [Microbacterium invictum]|uniref:Glutaminase n=1 Tax=Microbacterium invictum TaxID=515415 RepID=A0ABZ0VB30_9MICO|nr:glutaminase [Microbacterium invictum]WQB70823.1 glutaminase [Microbacterium invictum]
MSAVDELLAGARARLAGVPREGLGELLPPRRLLGIRRSPRIVRQGDAWHLGTLLLTDDELLATGDILRARAEVRRGFTAESQRRRAELAAAARRGGFAEGETVHIGWRRLDLDAIGRGAASDPVRIAGGEPQVRWSAKGGWVPLARYLEERVDLLLNPPGGAT